MEVLNEFKLLAADFSRLPGSVELRLEINGQSHIFPAQIYENGLLAFDFPEKLRVMLRQHPRLSQRLTALLSRLAKQQPVAFPVNLLMPEITKERQAA